jgi:hypothetical protein
MPLITKRTYLNDERVKTATSVLLVLRAELDALSCQVSAFGMTEGRRRSLGMVGQMASELVDAAATLYEKEMWYGGAALVRQVVEMEYVLFLFANDPTEADKWISAKPDEARRFFSPREMRARSNGKFDDAEYSAHCGLGGHPRKQGVLLLKDWMTIIDGASDEESIPVALWADLAEHATRIWKHLKVAVKAISPSNVYPERIEVVEIAIAAALKNKLALK